MYILLLFTAFIYNEFFVINIYGLFNSTKLFLDYIERNDLSLISENNINDHLIEMVGDQSCSNNNEHDRENSIELEKFK